MSDQWREDFEAQFLIGAPEKLRLPLFGRTESGKYVMTGVQSEWERYRMHRAVEGFMIAIIEALRLDQIVNWLSSHLQPRRK